MGWADFYLGNPVGEGGQVQSRNPGGRGGKKGALLVGHVEFFFFWNNPFTLFSITKLCYLITGSKVLEWDFSPILLIAPMHLLRLHSQYQSTLEAHVSKTPFLFSLFYQLGSLHFDYTLPAHGL